MSSPYEKRSLRAGSGVNHEQQKVKRNDPFKPRSFDPLWIFISPAAVYFYAWKRAGLEARDLSTFMDLNLVSFGLTTVLLLPVVMQLALQHITGTDLEKLSPLSAVSKHWPWYTTVYWLVLGPVYVAQMVLALKAFYLAQLTQKLIAAEDDASSFAGTVDWQAHDFANEFVDTQNPNLFSDIFSWRFDGLRVKEAIGDRTTPPTPFDVVAEDVKQDRDQTFELFEEEWILKCPAIVSIWFGPMRPVNIGLAWLTAWACTLVSSVVLTMLFGYPLLMAWHLSIHPDMAEYRQVFFGAAWLLLYTGGLFSIVGLINFLCWSFYRKVGISMQMRSL